MLDVDTCEIVRINEGNGAGKVGMVIERKLDLRTDVTRLTVETAPWFGPGSPRGWRFTPLADQVSALPRDDV